MANCVNDIIGRTCSETEHWAKSCPDCNTKKTPRTLSRASLPIPVEGPFDRLADVLGPFPPTDSGNHYIVCFSDYLTRWPEPFQVSRADAKTVAHILVDEILARHGAPRTLLSDQGANFLSKIVPETCALINTRKTNTTAYHPMTDGLIECFQGTLAQSLSMYVSANQKDWDVYIPIVLFAYRTSPSATTGESLFYLLYGRQPRLPINVSLIPREELSQDVSTHRAQLVERLKDLQRFTETSQRTN